MQCPYPRYIRVSEFTELEVPCGKCIPCKTFKAGEWTRRLQNHHQYNENCAFITLTYDDLSCPLFLNATPCLRKDDLLDFIRRLRRKFSDRKISYYAIGEYGHLTRRPHYHLLVFGIGYSEYEWYETGTRTRKGNKLTKSKVLDLIWPSGFAQIGLPGADGFAYVAGYVTEKIHDARSFFVPPFSLCSKGIGAEYCLSHERQLERNLHVRLNGRSVSIPRYYIKKLALDSSRASWERALKAELSLRAYAERNGLSLQDVKVLPRELAKLREAETIAKQNIRKRGTDGI
jgi:hypothetical protein